ncbi:MAG: NAD(+) diphosphatase [Alphaproteobacteria bacterium]|nr:NAD(+) diphosphatase [Alphaproteobacteria bacterium SS10]
MLRDAPLNGGNWYSHPNLDRLSIKRRDPQFYAERLYAPNTRFVPVWRGKHLIERQPAEKRGEPKPVYISPQVDWWPEYTASAPILLGESPDPDGDGPLEPYTYFAIDLSQIPDPKEFEPLNKLGAFVDLRRIGPLLNAGEAALMAYARGMITWHEKHKFCGVCGGPTALREAGFVRACLNPDCTPEGPTHHHPRTDPAVIMLVTDGADRCLLGRGHRLPPGLHSTLAGFVEPGESLEDAVAREVMEEVGVTVTDIRYHSSQPWPFPGSIMLGFYARATDFDITLDPEEMASADWYSRDWLKENGADFDVENPPEFSVPREDSIARRLLDDWLDGKVNP